MKPPTKPTAVSEKPQGAAIFQSPFFWSAISPEQLRELAQWLDTETDVPVGRWFKRFSGMTVCGKGELVKTFLLPGQAPSGEDVP